MVSRAVPFLSALMLSACASGGSAPGFAPVTTGRGYVTPAYLLPQPPPAVPQADSCNALLYQTLIGRHLGTVYLAGLPGRKRVLQPSETEGFDADGMNEPFAPLVEIRDYLPGQSVYLPSVATIDDMTRLGPVETDRLTVELDAEGVIQSLTCR